MKSCLLVLILFIIHINAYAIYEWENPENKIIRNGNLIEKNLVPKKIVCGKNSSEKIRKQIVKFYRKLLYIRSLKTILKDEIYADLAKTDADKFQFEIKLSKESLPYVIKPELRKKVLRVLEAEEDFFVAKEKAQLCIFRTQIQEQMKLTLNDVRNEKFLSKLSGISSCFANIENSSPLRRQDLGLFDDLFEDIFTNFYNKDELSNEDCNILRMTYGVWSSLYDEYNSSEVNSGENPIPLYNVNDHDDSLHYWIKERIEGNLPNRPLTLFHADTHTDMSHVHDYHGNHWSNSLSMSKIIYLLSIRDEEKFKLDLTNRLESQLVNKKDRYILETLKSFSPSQLKEILKGQLRKRTHFIAQPLTAAVAGQITNNIIMCMPPWSRQLPNNTKMNDKGKYIPYDLNLVKMLNSHNRFSLKFGSELGKNSKLEDPAFLKGGSPYLIFDSSKHNSPQKVSKVSMHVARCNNEAQRVEVFPDGTEEITTYIDKDVKLPALSNYFSKKDRDLGFILDIDLDVFVSEGGNNPQKNKYGSKFEPVSWEGKVRHEANFLNHNGHSSSNDLDPSPEVVLKEFGLIKERVRSLMDRLRQAEKDGYSPKVITIADSTLLRRAIATRSGDDAWTGNYTPSCLVFLLNYMVRKELSSIYNIETNTN